MFYLSGILTSQEAFVGFSDPGVVLAASTFVITKVLELSNVYKLVFSFLPFFFSSFLPFFLHPFLPSFLPSFLLSFFPSPFFHLLFLFSSLSSRYLFEYVFRQPKAIRPALAVVLPIMAIMSAFVNESTGIFGCCRCHYDCMSFGCNCSYFS